MFVDEQNKILLSEHEYAFADGTFVTYSGRIIMNAKSLIILHHFNKFILYQR